MTTPRGTTDDGQQKSALEQRFDEINKEESSVTSFDSKDVTRVIREERDGHPTS